MNGAGCLQGVQAYPEDSVLGNEKVPDMHVPRSNSVCGRSSWIQPQCLLHTLHLDPDIAALLRQNYSLVRTALAFSMYMQHDHTTAELCS